jgi:hypothetical protein
LVLKEENSLIQILLLVLAAVVASLVVEIALRLLFGLGDRIIYVGDPDIGYLLAPNQKVRRFGNRISIEKHSMRCDEFAEERPNNTLRIFLLGDSIANGGWWTDEDETISALMKQQLQKVTKTFTNVEVLNASANSWAPRNQLAYLKRFGTFQAQAIVLLINTDDLFAFAPTALVVGRDRSYPDKTPNSAIGELLERVFVRQKPIPGIEEIHKEKGDRTSHNLAAISGIRAIVAQNQAQFLLAITPLLREVDGTPPREYEQKARMRLQSFAQSEAIPFIDFLPLFQQVKQSASLYRDHIHLTPVGNRFVSETICQFLQKHWR